MAVVAPPGAGKTRLGVAVALSAGRSVVLARTREEVFEVYRLSGGRVAAVYGREALCPYGAGWGECGALRLVGSCRLALEPRRRLMELLAGTGRWEAVRGVAEGEGACPHPSSLALARGAGRVAATYAFAARHPWLLEGRDAVVYDEAQSLLDAVLSAVERLGVEEARVIGDALKRRGERTLAYRLRAAARLVARGGPVEPLVEAVAEAAGVLGELGELAAALERGRFVVWRGAVYALPGRVPRPLGPSLLLGVMKPPVAPEGRVEVVEAGEWPPLEVRAYRGVTSAYRARGEEMYSRYAELIAQLAPGDRATLLVFPSRGFMGEVLARLPGSVRARLKPAEAIRSAAPGDIVVDVAGGPATEGVNPSEALGAVIVAGAPFPEPSGELKLVSRETGIADPYTYIAALRAVQAAGRLRRGGEVHLLDERFLSDRLLEALPRALAPRQG